MLGDVSVDATTCGGHANGEELVVESAWDEMGERTVREEPPMLRQG